MARLRFDRQRGARGGERLASGDAAGRDDGHDYGDLRIAAGIGVLVSAGDLRQPRRTRGTAPRAAQALLNANSLGRDDALTRLSSFTAGRRLSPRSQMKQQGDLMRNLMFAAVGLTAIGAAAPAMAQAGPSAYDPSAYDPPVAAMGPAANAAGGRWELLQGYGKDGEVIFTWYYVTAPDFGRYHGS